MLMLPSTLIPLPLVFALKPLLPALAPNTDLQSFSLVKPFPPASDLKPLLPVAEDCSTTDDSSTGEESSLCARVFELKPVLIVLPLVSGRSREVPDAGAAEELSQAREFSAAEEVACAISRLKERVSRQRAS